MRERSTTSNGTEKNLSKPNTLAFEISTCIMFLLDAQREALRGNRQEAERLVKITHKKLEELPK
jgi:hypothetical protein